MDAVAIATAAASIVEAIIKVAPAIEQGVASSAPFVQAISGLISGTNATQEQVDTLLASVNAASAQFDAPLPVDDGSTST